jgi:hypothetical protein
MNPNISPFDTERLSRLTATTLPKRFVRFLSSIISKIQMSNKRQNLDKV